MRNEKIKKLKKRKAHHKKTTQSLCTLGSRGLRGTLASSLVARLAIAGLTRLLVTSLTGLLLLLAGSLALSAATRTTHLDTLHASHLKTLRDNTHGLKHGAGLSVDLNSLNGDLRDVRDVVVTTLTLLLLKLERNATDGALLNTLHEMGHETSDLVAHGLGRNESNLSADTLVGVEVESKTRIVLLDDGTSSLLDGLYTHATHFLCFLICAGIKKRKQKNPNTTKTKI